MATVLQVPEDMRALTRLFADDGIVPNNPALPAVLMLDALPQDAGAYAICTRYAACGWGGTWTFTVFDYCHYHPDAHEALAVASGTAEIQLGGPEGEVFTVSAGDVMVLPAGTGHCRMSSSPDFVVCGAYPPGQENCEIVRALPANRGDAVRRIASMPLPATDPIYGANGPLLDLWPLTV